LHPTNRLAVTASGDGAAHVWKIPKPNEEKKPKDDKPDHSVKAWSPLLEKERSESKSSANMPMPIDRSSEKSMPIDGSVPPPPPSLEGYTQDVPGSLESSPTFVTITRPIFEMKHKGPVIAGEWSPSGDRIITGSWDNTVKIWSVENGKCLIETEAGHDVPHYLTNITTHHSGPFFLTSSSDGYFRLWDTRAAQPLTNSVQAHSEY
jgi:WD40 repeat protein